jgi:hypothetical protein
VRVVVVKISCYLFVGMLCLGLLVLEELTSSEPSNYDWYYYEEDYYEGMSCDNYIIGLIISN